MPSPGPPDASNGETIARACHGAVNAVPERVWPQQAATGDIMTSQDPRRAALDALTVRYEEDGTLLVEELARVVIASSPLWATLAFLARERDRATGEWRAPRVQLRRYKRRGDRFVVEKHFTLTGRAQADAVAAALATWFSPGGPGLTDGSAGEDDE
jgi:hypothetical protein